MNFSVQPNKNNVLDYVARGLCVCCGGTANYFEDSVSIKYYNRTGLCQECQHKQYEHKRKGTDHTEHYKKYLQSLNRKK